jgi:A/G-specific adenine glycosylase
MPQTKLKSFIKAVEDNYALNGRKLPWRWTKDNPVEPWGVLVSEFMLQQTGTERVLRYWKPWLERWPSPAALAASPLEDALRAWQGLGYNRRCKHLCDAAAAIAKDYGNTVPQDEAALRRLPGVGEYTAGAIACFAYNRPCVFVETNIRAAVIHWFFSPEAGNSDKITDDDVKAVLQEALQKGGLAPEARRWYYALMDYGAALKKVTANPNRRSASYSRQSSFEGSFRQKRAAVLRACLAGEPPPPQYTKEEAEAALASLRKDGLVPS